MDDSNTAASTSTAATVANGARAVDDEKSATNLRSSTYSANTVKLLIKASNQQYDDHAIDGDLQWTVKRLKAHLADVYPSKPAITEQKLIYSGQLLNDNLILKDVIRNYKDICTQNHIIHLVCSAAAAAQSTMNKAQHRANTSSVGNGNRNRNGNDNASSSASRDGQTANGNVHNSNENRNFVNNGSSANANLSQTQYFHQQFPTYPSNYLMMWHQMRNMQYGPWAAAGYPVNGQYGGNMPFVANQETAMNNWIRQVYNQYMTQYLRAMHEPENANNAASTDNNFVRIAANFPYFGPFVMPSNANQSVNMPPVITPTITPNNSHSTSNRIENNPPAAPANIEAETQGPNPQQNDPQVPVIGRQFRNIPDDEPNNGDWLESVFVVIRILLFVTIFYFNFSPVRYMIVITIATVIFCYHTGILRINHERNNNNVNRNNNAAGAETADAAAAAAAAVDQIRQGVEQQDQTSPAEASATDSTNLLQSQSANANNVNSNTTVTMRDRRSSIAFAISFLRTFVVTFFTSLLPETPAI